jgi:hypothetical protein
MSAAVAIKVRAFMVDPFSSTSSTTFLGSRSLTFAEPAGQRLYSFNRPPMARHPNQCATIAVLGRLKNRASDHILRRDEAPKDHIIQAGDIPHDLPSRLPRPRAR